jgi:membrane protease YdiL (CAAX protease family)
MAPPSNLTIAAFAFELLLVLAGLVVLWKARLSPAARRQPAPALLPQWDISLSDFCLFLCGVFMAVFIAQVAAWFTLRFAGSVSKPASQIIAGAEFQLSLLVACLAFHFLPSVRAKRVPRPPAPISAPLAGGATFLIALPVVMAVALAWQVVLTRLGFPVEEQELIDLFRQTDSRWLLGGLIILASVVAPITEELIFRAGLFRYLNQRTPRWLALLMPACLFGALHANLASFLPLVALGILFSLAYERTGNIAVSMVAHSLFNLNTMMLIFAGVTV